MLLYLVETTVLAKRKAWWWLLSTLVAHAGPCLAGVHELALALQVNLGTIATTHCAGTSLAIAG